MKNKPTSLASRECRYSKASIYASHEDCRLAPPLDMHRSCPEFQIPQGFGCNAEGKDRKLHTLPLPGKSLRAPPL